MQDLANSLSVLNTIDPVVGAADTNGTGVDLQGFESAVIVVPTGIEGVTLSSSVKIDFKLEESSDNSTFTAVSDNTSVTDGAVDANGIFSTLDANGETPQISVIGYVGGSRYIRVVADFTGTHSTGTPIAAQVIRGTPRHNSDTDSITIR
jgi:hypothetical protein